MAKVEMYKEGIKEGMTPEQNEKWEKLIEMGWRDVARVWREWCDNDNQTDEFKAMCEAGLIAGVGMDRD